jgi:putative membrane protein
MIADLVISVKVIRHCFSCYKSQTFYLCIGLLIGSLYAIASG